MVKRIRSKCGVVKVAVHNELEMNDIKNMVKNYNRVSKKYRKKKIVLPKSGIINISDIYGQFDPDIYSSDYAAKKVKKEKAAYNRFLADIRRNVNRGIPLVWSVILGLVQEEIPLPQRISGHMRIIMGYNDKTGEIIYTDTWGEKHEFKKMSYAKAWAINTMLASLVPRKIKSR